MKSTKIAYKKCRSCEIHWILLQVHVLGLLMIPELSLQGSLFSFILSFHFPHFIVFQIHLYSSFIFFASPSTSPAMAVCTSYGDLSLLVKCSQLPLQAWFTSFRNGLLPNRNRFTDFKQLRTGSRKSIHRFTQPYWLIRLQKCVYIKTM